MLRIFSVLSETVATVSLSARNAFSTHRRPLSTCQCVILRTDKTRPSKLNYVFKLRL